MIKLNSENYCTFVALKRTIMAKIGYVWLAPQFDTLSEDKKWMADYGCFRIAEEQATHEKLRPEWKHIIDNMCRGDELVVSKFSNALRGPRELAIFFEICRIKGVRIISIHDRIDSLNILFPETRTSDILNMLGALSAEVAAVRRSASHLNKLKHKPLVQSAKGISRLERNKTIINMYKSGCSLSKIIAASGLRSKTSIFTILNNAGVNLDRGRTRGPIKKRTSENEKI